MKREKVAYIKEAYRDKVRYIEIYINGLCNSMYEAENQAHMANYEEKLRDLRLMGYLIAEV